METKDKKTSEKKGNKRSLTSAVRRVIKDRELLNDFALWADLYAAPLTC